MIILSQTPFFLTVNFEYIYLFQAKVDLIILKNY